MTIPKVKPFGWGAFEKLTSAEITTIDEHTTWALDKRAGESDTLDSHVFVSDNITMYPGSLLDGEDYDILMTGVSTLTLTDTTKVELDSSTEINLHNSASINLYDSAKIFGESLIKIDAGSPGINTQIELRTASSTSGTMHGAIIMSDRIATELPITQDKIYNPFTAGALIGTVSAANTHFIDIGILSPASGTSFKLTLTNLVLNAEYKVSFYTGPTQDEMRWSPEVYGTFSTVVLPNKRYLFSMIYNKLVEESVGSLKVMSVTSWDPVA